jgi:hypothetical protein
VNHVKPRACGRMWDVHLCMDGEMEEAFFASGGSCV